MKKVSCIVFLLMLKVLCVAQTNLEKLFEDANKNYEKKHYQESIDEYLKIIDAGYSSDVVFYNLGNSYYKNKENTKAIIYFEKAIKANPHCRAAKTNLFFARQKNLDKIVPISDIILLKAWKKWKDVFSANEWAIGSILFCWVATSFALYILFSSVLFYKKISLFLCVFSVFLCVFCGTIAFERNQYLSSANEAIVVSPTVALKTSPDTSSNTSVSLHEGTKLSLEDHIGQWYRIKLEDGRFGWMEKKYFLSY